MISINKYNAAYSIVHLRLYLPYLHVSLRLTASGNLCKNEITNFHGSFVFKLLELDCDILYSMVLCN